VKNLFFLWVVLAGFDASLARTVAVQRTRDCGRLLQLVYTIWFPERPPRGGVDFLASL